MGYGNMTFESDIEFPVAGLMIAVISSLINGSTFVLQKKGMLRAEAKGILRKTSDNINWNLTGTGSLIS